MKKLTPVSVVGILDYEGAHEIFKNLMVKVHEEQAAYVQMVNDLCSEMSGDVMRNDGEVVRKVSDRLMEVCLNNKQQQQE